MRRALVVRCLAVGVLRTEDPDGAWCEVRHAWLQVNGSAACVRTAVTWEAGRRRVERTIELDQFSARHRLGERPFFDRLVSLSESMVEGEHGSLQVWVSSMRPMALLSAIPVDSGAAADTPRRLEAVAAARPRPRRANQVATDTSP